MIFNVVESVSLIPIAIQMNKITLNKMGETKRGNTDRRKKSIGLTAKRIDYWHHWIIRHDNNERLHHDFCFDRTLLVGENR